MGGDKGKVREGRINEGLAGFQGGPIIQGGTLGRDQQEKRPRVLLKQGKVQPGTMAYRLQQKK
jgi:hypothetical protein